MKPPDIRPDLIEDIKEEYNENIEKEFPKGSYKNSFKTVKRIIGEYSMYELIEWDVVVSKGWFRTEKCGTFSEWILYKKYSDEDIGLLAIPSAIRGNNVEYKFKEVDRLSADIYSEEEVRKILEIY